jgi:hypothetical protein
MGWKKNEMLVLMASKIMELAMVDFPSKHVGLEGAMS